MNNPFEKLGLYLGKAPGASFVTSSTCTTVAFVSALLLPGNIGSGQCHICLGYIPSTVNQFNTLTLVLHLNCLEAIPASGGPVL